MAGDFRETKLTVSLGGEQVRFVSMRAKEELSDPFAIELEIAAPLGELDLGEHLGKPCSVAVFEDDDEVRHFNGFLTEAVYLRESADGFHYMLSLRSFLHFLESRSGFAIHQEKTVIDIIKDTLERAGTSDFEFRVKETYEPLEYCVQYNESDFNFISRLMETDGLYYFFEHTAAKHTLIICDSASNHKPCSVAGLTYNPTAREAQSYKADGLHYLSAWAERVATTGHSRVIMRDFDFEKPTKPVEAEESEASEHQQDEQELFEFPGGFVKESTAKRLSRVRLEELRALRTTFVAEASAKGLAVGAIVSVSSHPVDRYNKDYLIVSTTHSLKPQSYRSGTNDRETDSIQFAAIPADVQFRAARTTVKPRVVGLESAIVTGPEGETIHTDEYGRIKVRFHWDREDSPDPESTCWMRVSQTGGLGNVILPRVGHEVLVDFLHGDPDQPIVTGRVFNKSHMPIYDLPANKTVALWRSLTYGDQTDYPDTEALDTGEPQANEIRFEDKGGKEEMFIHAERLMNVRVRFDHSFHIGHDQELKVGHDRQRYVKNDEKVTIDGNREYTLEKNEKNTITSGDRTTTLEKGDDTLKVSKGDLSISTDAGKVKIKAAKSIELIVGGSVIKMTPAKISIKATSIDIDGKAMTKVKAGGILTEKAGLIKIN